MRILLTGGTGQVGKEFLLRSEGLHVLAPTRTELDLAQPDSVSQWLEQNRPELILNVGAYTAVDRAEVESDFAFRVNRDAVVVFAKYANQKNAPLIHLSTDYVFDGTKASAYVETDETNPTCVYGVSKLAGELAARTADQHLILRVSWVFSAFGSNFVRTMLRLGAECDELRVVDDQVGGPTWAGHIAQSLRALVDRHLAGKPLARGIWHHSGAPHLSWCEFAREIFRQATDIGLLSKAPRIQAISSAEFPTKAKRPANSRLDSHAAAHSLGLKIPDWRSGLNEMLQVLKQC